MKPRNWVLAFVVVGLAVAGLLFLLVRQLVPPAADPTELDPRRATVATAFLDRLDAGAWDAAHAMLAPVAADKIDAGQLEAIWSGLPGQLGARSGRSAPRGEQVGEHELVTVTLQFELLALDARISVDADDRIDGFRIVPARTTASAPPPPSDLVERELAVGEPPLGATLTLPAGPGPFPGVVLVHGSGSHDRDQTIGPNRVFRELAHGLARRGIAVLRYEKRDAAQLQARAGGYTIDHETVDDAIAALAALRREDGIAAERVFVLGHSLGAMMAPRILQRAPQAAGGILLAAPARPLDEVVPEQVAYLADLDGSRSEAERTALEQAQQAAAAVRALADGGAEDGLLLGLPAPYWRDLLDYDPVAVAATLPQPLLLLHGGRDYQVTMTDFQRWLALADGERVQLQLYPALNHLFAAGEGASRPEEYFRRAELDPRPLDDIAGWIRGR